MTPDRFFTLLLALHERQSTTTTELARRTGISVRTAVRDLQWLQEAGFPIHVQRGRTGGVTLLPGGALDISRLTPNERDHLGLAGLDDQQRDRLGATTDSARAHQKVARGNATPGLLPLSTVVTTDNQPWFRTESAGTLPAELTGELRRGVRLRLRYRRSSESETSWHTVDPYGLLAKAGRWYLIADKNSSPRLFALERINDWTALRTRRRIRAGATLRSVADQLTSTWESTRDIAVEAQLRRKQLDRAQRMLGTQLTVHGDATAEWIRITVGCRESEDVRALLPFADDLTVLGPPEARTRIRDLAAATYRQYE